MPDILEDPTPIVPFSAISISLLSGFLFWSSLISDCAFSEIIHLAWSSRSARECAWFPGDNKSVDISPSPAIYVTIFILAFVKRYLSAFIQSGETKGIDIDLSAIDGDLESSVETEQTEPNTMIALCIESVIQDPQEQLNLAEIKTKLKIEDSDLSGEIVDKFQSDVLDKVKGILTTPESLQKLHDLLEKKVSDNQENFTFEYDVNDAAKRNELVTQLKNGGGESGGKPGAEPGGEQTGGFAKITGFLAESKGFVNGLSAGLVTLAALSLKAAPIADFK